MLKTPFLARRPTVLARPHALGLALHRTARVPRRCGGSRAARRRGRRSHRPLGRGRASDRGRGACRKTFLLLGAHPRRPGQKGQTPLRKRLGDKATAPDVLDPASTPALWGPIERTARQCTPFAGLWSGLTNVEKHLYSTAPDGSRARPRARHRSTSHGACAPEVVGELGRPWAGAEATGPSASAPAHRRSCSPTPPGHTGRAM